MSKRTHFTLLITTLILSIFTILDAYILPETKHVYTCTNAILETRPTAKLQKDFYFVEANKKRYAVTKNVYDIVSIGDTVYIERSAFTNANLFLLAKHNGETARSNIGFIQNGGMFFLGFVTVTIILTMLFYEKIPFSFGRQNLVIFSLSMFGIIFFLHLTGSHY